MQAPIGLLLIEEPLVPALTDVLQPERLDASWPIMETFAALAF